MDPGRLKVTLSRTLPNARYLGDKKPSYIFALERFVRTRQISIVIIYRDCRDVVAANLMRVRARRRPSRHQHRFDTAAKIAARWVDCISLMEQHADAVLSIRYEELVRSPMGEIGRIADRLNLSFGDFDESIINTVHTRDIGLYENYLAPVELATIEEIAGSTMARYGYR